jgi:hypothetical protein
MKKFSLKGNTAIWDALKVVALNTATDEKETRSAIPTDKRLVVNVVNNYYRVYDKNVRQILHGEISEEDNTKVISRLTKSNRPDFVLFHEGKIVGWASFHRKTRKYSVCVEIIVEAKSEEEAAKKVYEELEKNEKTADFYVCSVEE